MSRNLNAAQKTSYYQWWVSAIFCIITFSLQALRFTAERNSDLEQSFSSFSHWLLTCSLSLRTVFSEPNHIVKKWERTCALLFPVISQQHYNSQSILLRSIQPVYRTAGHAAFVCSFCYISISLHVVYLLIFPYSVECISTMYFICLTYWASRQFVR